MTQAKTLWQGYVFHILGLLPLVAFSVACYAFAIGYWQTSISTLVAWGIAAVACAVVATIWGLWRFLSRHEKQDMPH